MENYDVLIIGCGPCGMGCALSLYNQGVNFAIIEGGTPGGKVNIAPRVDNYPGYTKIPGPELAINLYQRIVDKKIPVIFDNITSLTKEDDYFTLKGNKEYKAKFVVLASGTQERKLGLEHEEELLGHGLSYCAVCDGHFFKDKDIIIVGGGNSALKEAIYLSNIVKSISLVHRRDQFRGNEKLVEELLSLGKTKIYTPYVPKEILCDTSFKGLVIEHRETGETLTLHGEGFFPLVGQIPNTQLVHIDNVLDEYGTIPVSKEMESNCPNLFAGGDILPRQLRQIYLSEHDGIVIAKTILNRINL